MKVLLLRTLAVLVFTLVGVAVFSSVAHAATFTVDSTGDGANTGGPGVCDDGLGACTLRAAIEASNATAGADVIDFNIAGAGVHTITPASVYPNISEQVTIDGSTQPGSSCGTLVPSIPSATNTPHTLNIEIDDTAGGWLWFDVGSENSVLKGLNIHSGPDPTWINVFLATDDLTVECNYIGTDPTGASIAGNPAGSGVFVNDLVATGILIQNNLISGHQVQGIFFTGSGTIQRNLLGTDATGTAAIANVIAIDCYDNTDDLTIDTNVISGNNAAVIKDDASQVGTPDFVITNNNVGLDLGGSSLPNGFAIDIRYIQSALITGNTSDDNGQTGIQVLFGHNVTVSTNNATGNVAGIFLLGTNNPGDTATVSSNIVNSNNSGFGIGVNDFDTVQALNNTMNNNTGDGASINAFGNLTVSNNTATNNTQAGMLTSGPGQVNNNVTSNNGGNGLVSGANTFDNTANSNGSTGILVSGGNAHDNMTDGNNTGMGLSGSNAIVNHNTMINSTSNGLEIFSGSDNVVTNNYIGVRSDGTIAGNTLDGIFVTETTSVNIGGSTPSERNYISGNLNNGIHIFACGTNVTQGVNVTGNYIGTDLNGTVQSGYGNGRSGIAFNEQSLVGCGGGGGGGSVYRNSVGGDAVGLANTIAGNGEDGVRVFQAPGMDVYSNAILPNVIYGNANLGINLAADSTNSGEADQDLGPNALNSFLMAIPPPNANYYLNHPIINSSTYNGSQLTINYNFDANQADNVTLQQSNVVGYRLDFYINDNAQDGAYPGYNQGKTYLGHFIVNGSETNASHTFTSPVTLSDSQSINAEATVLWANPGPP